MSECNHSPTVQLWALTNDNKCPVCLAARLAEAVRILTAWDQADAIIIDPDAEHELYAEAEKVWGDMHDFLRATDSAEHRETETHG